MRRIELSEAVESLIATANDKEKFSETLNLLSEVNIAELVLVCLQALSREPKAHLIRLKLARLLLETDCTSFSLEQLKILQNSCQSSALNELMENISNLYTSQLADKAGSTLASVDFDIELLDEDKN